jgi:hypothetical protein
VALAAKAPCASIVVGVSSDSYEALADVEAVPSMADTSKLSSKSSKPIVD